MAKDPALLWYWSDWNSGTSLLSRHTKGCYMDVMHAQFFHGHLSLDEIKAILGSDFESVWPTLQKKFKTDSNGLFFNERMEIEKEKRAKFTESRRNNLNSKTTHKDVHINNHMEHHMVNDMDLHMENENRNINKDKYIKDKEIFEKARKLYPGIKRGLDTEFDNFKKKHKDWKEVLLLLEEKIKGQISMKKSKANNGEFVPEWKNFSTWINNRCWEEEIGKSTSNNSNLGNVVDKFINREEKF